MNYTGSFGDRMAKVIQLLGMILPKVRELRKVFRTYFLITKGGEIPYTGQEFASLFFINSIKSDPSM